MSEEQSRADITLKVRGLLGQATILRARGQHGEALKLAQEALTLDEKNAEIHELIGDLLMASGRGAEAFDSFRRARELSPGRTALEDKLARAALRRADKLRSAQIAEAMLAGTYKPEAPPRKPGYAAVFSLLIPGLGQIYNGELLRGLAILAGYVLLLVLTSLGVRGEAGVGPGGWAGTYVRQLDARSLLSSLLGGVGAVWIILLLLLWIYAVADAAIRASKTMTSEGTGIV